MVEVTEVQDDAKLDEDLANRENSPAMLVGIGADPNFTSPF